jgi:cytoskeletal protein RodZ
MDIRIGKQLTQAREALGLIVEDVAHRTKIPSASIRYLESEDYSHFPNNVYAKSFLRLYSKFLNVDPASYLAEREGRLITHEDEVAFLEGIAVGSEFQDLEEEEPEKKISPGVVTTVALLVLGIPAAFVVSKIYDDPSDKPTKPVAAEEASPAPPTTIPVEPNISPSGSQTVSSDPDTSRTDDFAPLPPDETEAPEAPPVSKLPPALPVNSEASKAPEGQPLASINDGEATE